MAEGSDSCSSSNASLVTASSSLHADSISLQEWPGTRHDGHDRDNDDAFEDRLSNGEKDTLHLHDGKNQQVSSGENHLFPSGENQQVHSGENQHVPSGENQLLPSGEHQLLPSGENQQVPSGENQQVPSGDNQQHLSGDQHFPRGEDSHLINGKNEGHVPDDESQHLANGDSERLPNGGSLTPNCSDQHLYHQLHRHHHLHPNNYLHHSQDDVDFQSHHNPQQQLQGQRALRNQLTHPAHGFFRKGRQSADLRRYLSEGPREHKRFTVTPVRQSSLNHAGSSGRKHLAVFELGEDADATDTLTQNSITSLLSAKFRDLSKRWKQYGEESPRFRKRLVSKWESMNYDQIDSQLLQEENNKLKNKSKKKLALTWVSRWVMMFLVGIGTSLLAAGVHIAVELVAHEKFHLIAKYLDKCAGDSCLIKPVAIWCGINLGISLLAAALVTYVQPKAAGSGIPLIKSYLNGVRIPGLLSLRCFIAKTVGVVLSILGGLACGKEGPMAHSGGIMAAGLGKGRIPWFNRDFKLYNVFRTDHEVRDFVAAGAASGVSAAFGAPVGGTLFSVEEAASFWNTELVWRVFFSAMIACFSTNFLLSAFEGHPTELSHPGLVRFNTFPNLTFDLIEIPVFIVMAVIGGLTGALFVVMNYKLTVFRQKYLHRHNWIKIAESGLVSVVSAVAGFLLMFGVRECTTAKPNSSHAITTSMFCEEGSFNSMSTMFLTTPEGCLKSLLHDPLESYGVVPLVAFIVVFFLLGVWTYGLSVSSGVFIPSLAIGAAWGRLIGMGVVQLFPEQSSPGNVSKAMLLKGLVVSDAYGAKDVGKYALIGAASQLGGILRTTISLTVIIVECTGDISFGLCIMITLMISKWVGDFFTTGLYDMNVEVSGIPLLSWEPPPLSDNIRVSEFMSHPVLSLLPREKVGHILDILENETFHGFPIIQQDPSSVLQYKGKLRGMVLRDQLLTMLQKKAFAPEGKRTSVMVSAQEFNDPYPVSQRVSIKDLDIEEDEKHCIMDFRPYMSRTPYVVNPDFSMPRVFRLFRGLGLRHLVVIDEDYQPIGMVTRKDLAKYRAGTKRGMLHMEQLTIESV